MEYKTTKDLRWFTNIGGHEVIRCAVPTSLRGGRWPKGHPIGIVFHYTAGCGSDLSAVFQNRRVSAHFSVDREGNIRQYVPLDEVAYHADRANGYYYGVEHTALPGTCDLTDEQLEASAMLAAALVHYVTRRWGFNIPLRKIEGPDLRAGFHDHADGDGVTWNLNRHVDRLYRWTWAEYLDTIRSHLFVPRYVVVRQSGKRTRPLPLKEAMSRVRELARKMAAGTVVRVKKVLVKE